MNGIPGLGLWPIQEHVDPGCMSIAEAGASMARIAAGKSARLSTISTSCVFRTAASSIVETHAATALPSATA
jgi:hypothetical protein